MTYPEDQATMSIALLKELSEAVVPVDEAHAAELRDDVASQGLLKAMGAEDRWPSVLSEDKMLYLPLLGLATVLANAGKRAATVPSLEALRVHLVDALYHGGIGQMRLEFPTYKAAFAVLDDRTRSIETIEAQARARTALEMFAGLAMLFRMGIELPETESTDRIREVLAASDLLPSSNSTEGDDKLSELYRRIHRPLGRR